MRLAALLLIGTATAAHAQSSAVSVGFLPIPNTLPAIMFAPDPLAGTLLQPFAMPEIGAMPLVTPAVADLVVPPPPPEAAPSESALATAPEGVATPISAESAPPLDPVLPPVEGEALLDPAADAAPGLIPPAEPAEGTVTVIVENVETASGNVNVAICDTDLSREGCPFVQEIKAEAGFVQTQFQDIPPGTYAVVGYHDVNGNDEFDKFMGVPREPYALSAGAADKLVPSFADAALQITPGENAVIIRLKRLGG